MSDKYQIDELREIAVSAISSTSDKTNFGRGDPVKDPTVKELAENMKQTKVLLHPITVIERADSTPEQRRYDVVIGHRRFAAWKTAFPEKKTIRCLVLPSDTTTTRKDMLTVSENLLRLDYDPQDKGKVIQMLLPYWDNDLKRLATALGYETTAVLQEWLDMLEIPQDVIERLKGPEPLKVKRARLLRKLPLPLQGPAADIINERGGDYYDVRKFVYALKEHPSASPEDIADMIASKPRTKSLFVSISENTSNAMDIASEDFHMTKAELAAKAINDLLNKQGYFDSEGKAVERKTIEAT